MFFYLLTEKVKNLAIPKEKEKKERFLFIKSNCTASNKNIGRQEILVNPILPSTSESEALGVLEVSH